MNEQDKLDIVNGVVERLSNGEFKKDITERLDKLHEKFDQHISHADTMFTRVLTKVNSHEKKFKVLAPFVMYFGLAGHDKRWVRAGFWMSILILLFLITIIDWKAIGYYGFEKITGAELRRFIK